MKLLFKLIIIYLLFSMPSFSLTLNEINYPKGLLGKISNSNKIDSNTIEIEKKEEQKEAEINIIDEETATNSENKEEEVQSFATNYADLSLKRIANDVSFELSQDEQKINSDLSILWQATTERSETMKYTIYKLSNPDEDKPKDSAIKKILKPIANFSSIAGASLTGDPYMATGALIGSGLINAFMKDDKEINYRFSKISDADMVLLVRKIDSLQKKLIDLYVDYKTKEQIYYLEQENFSKREEIYKKSQNKSKEELIIADVNYRNSKIKVQKAQDEFLTSKAVLENLVGVEAINKITD